MLDHSNPSTELSSFLESMKQAPTVEVWTSQNSEHSFPVTNKVAITKLSEWVESQIIEYDHEDSIYRQSGKVCGCRPFVSFILPDNQTLVIHGDNLIVNNSVSFKSVDPYEFNYYTLTLLFFQVGIWEENQLLQVTSDEGLILYDFLERYIYNDPIPTNDLALKQVFSVVTSQLKRHIPKADLFNTNLVIEANSRILN